MNDHSALTRGWHCDPAFWGKKRATVAPQSIVARLTIKQGFKMNKFFSRFAKDESGATAIEYGLIAALIAVAIIAAVTLLGENLSATFDNLSGTLGGEAGAPPAP